MMIESIFSLKGKTAFLSGAAGYLGREMAYALGKAGAHVIINGRDSVPISALAQELTLQGLSVEIAIFDITDEKSVANYFSKISSLNILINNAYQGGSGSIEHSKSQDYRESYEVSLVSVHNLVKAALPALRESVSIDSDASVINIASMYGIVSPDIRIYENPQLANPAFYGAAKAALIQWTRYAACEFGSEGIRVNSISPGAFPSQDFKEKSIEFVERLANKVPMGRIGLAEEIKGPVLFLASSAASYVNGSNLVVDGGWTAW
ncbi:SDR family oxidoreductase [Candidatus Pseudothioglobus singularis]|nr:SDR family oxidoreductase [Candidatus Pseudothioglobus singularis]